MKKKQLFAVLLAGSMTVGMAPAAAFAAEDTGAAAAEAQAAEENTGAADGTEFDAQTNVDGADSQQEDTDGQADAQTDTDAGAQAAADAEAQAAAEAQAQAEAEAQAQAEAAQQLEQEQAAAADQTVEEHADAVVKTTEELKNAIAGAPDFTGNIDDTRENLYTSSYKILISESFSLTESITIPENKNIAIFSAQGSETSISRGTVTGDMFRVSAGSILSMTKNDGDGTTSVGKLVVDGAKADGTQADGSIVSVDYGAKFVMTTGVTLANNSSAASGAAIRNSGKTVITGGEIRDNISAGGAVYSIGTVSLEKGTDAAEDEPKIIENYTNAEKSAKMNIVLGQQDQNNGQIIIAGAFKNSNIGYSVENPIVGYTVFTGSNVGSDAFIAAVNEMSYEGDQSFGINTATGQLASKIPVVIVKNLKSEKENTVSVKITSDKAGTYFYKYVKKNAEPPKFDESTVTKGVWIAAGTEASFDISGITDKSVDLYVWVKTADGFVGESGKNPVDVKQAQKPDNPTAPTVKKVSAKKTGTTTAEVVIKSSKEGTCYYTWVAKGSAKPSINTKSSKVSVKANTDSKISLEKLRGDAIDLYVQVVAKDGTKSEVTKIATVTLKETTTKTPAEISNVSYKWKSHTSANVTMRSNKTGQYYYTWVKKGSATPTINTKGNGIKISANRDFTINLQNLDADNAIDVYVSIKGTDGTVSKPKKIALDEAKRPANVRWVGFQWTSHTSATVKFVISRSGRLYYAWTTRDNDGNSKKPDIYNSGNSIETGADREISIYLNDLDSDKAIDLYVRFKDNNGIETVPLKVRFKEENRPAEGHDPVIYKASESKVYGLDNPLEFYPNVFYEFKVIGAGTTNDNPGEQDVKWVPLYWSTSANPSDKQKHSAWKIGFTEGINKEKTYNMYVFFQKYVYVGGQWQETDTVESAIYQFRSATWTPTGTPGVDGTDGQTGTDPDATVTGEASATSSNGGNGSTSRSAVSTADNSPIGTMSALAVASLLAGGYVIVRRRKKDI